MLSDPNASAGILPTPTEMIAHLDRFVLGQERAKRDLSVAVYNHFLSSRYAESPDAEHADLERQHILLLGPTGSGKTFLVRMLGTMLGVPVSIASATSFAETGYVGDHVESLVANLLTLTDWDIARAQRGVVFVDEIDKIRRAQMSTRDVSGEGVQSGLLTLLDGHDITIRSRSGGRTAVIDVSKILFVCTGAFVGLEEIVRQRLRRERGSSFGFGALAASVGLDPEAMSQDELRQLVRTEDLQEFGMIPEFIGRFSTISALRSLTREELVRIMAETEDSVLAKQKTLFRLHGMALEFDRAALDAIAREAEKHATGARGLRRAMLRALDPIDYRLPELASEGVTGVRVTEETVLAGKEPVLQYGETRSHATRAEELRQTALLPAPLKGPVGVSAAARAGGITDTAGWSREDIRKRLDEVLVHLDWPNTTGSAKKWWRAFESENEHRLGLVLRLAEELLIRKATIAEFFLAYVYSNTDNIQANLHYLDYTRLKQKAEKKPGQGSDDSDDDESTEG